jgi:hypothetical protein
MAPRPELWPEHLLEKTQKHFPIRRIRHQQGGPQAMTVQGGQDRQALAVVLRHGT